MNEIEYQKIKLHSSTEYAYNKNIFDERINAIEKIVKENNIDYALEVVDSYVRGISSKAPKKLYTLNLVIKKEDTQKVKEILDEFYKYTFQILEEKFEEEQIINKEKEENDNSDEAIKMNETIGEKMQEIKEEIEEAPTIGKFSIIFIFVINVALVVFEIILFIETDFNCFLLIPMFLQVVIFLSALYDVIGKRGE